MNPIGNKDTSTPSRPKTGSHHGSQSAAGSCAFNNLSELVTAGPWVDLNCTNALPLNPKKSAFSSFIPLLDQQDGEKKEGFHRRCLLQFVRTQVEDVEVDEGDQVSQKIEQAAQAQAQAQAQAYQQQLEMKDSVTITTNKGPSILGPNCLHEGFSWRCSDTGSTKRPDLVVYHRTHTAGGPFHPHIVGEICSGSNWQASLATLCGVLVDNLRSGLIYNPLLKEVFGLFLPGQSAGPAFWVQACCGDTQNFRVQLQFLEMSNQQHLIELLKSALEQPFVDPWTPLKPRLEYFLRLSKEQLGAVEDGLYTEYGEKFHCIQIPSKFSILLQACCPSSSRECIFRLNFIDALFKLLLT